MKNHLLTILFIFAAFSSFSQNYDYLQAYRRFTLAGRSVKGISNDTTMLFGSADSLVTQYALKGYLAGHGIGIKGRQHQLLGAKADSTAELQYLEPLVEGAFIVSDSELNAVTLVPAIYDLRNGEKWVSDNAGNFTKDTSGNTYFTDYGVRRFLYNPTTQKTFYVKPDSSYSQIGSGNVFNVHADTTINNTYVNNDNNYYYNLGDSSYLDSRDFYNDGTITTPYRVRRYDNAYIDSLFASITPGGGGGGGGTTVNNYYTNKLPFNGDTSFYLAGDSLLHKLPAFTASTTSPLKLTTNGQSGPSTLDTATNTLNVPNYFFASNAGDSIDYSLSAMTTIYNEKGPGEYLTSGHGVTINPDNFNFPFKQLKALDVSGWNAGDYVSFSNATTANSTAYTFMRAFIRLKQAVPVIQSLSFQFYLNGVAVSKIISMVNYGLDKSMINKYQNISIPMSAFGFTDNNFDEIRLIFGGGSSADGLYLDLFQFQNATVEENKYVTDVFRIPGTTTVQKVLGGQNSFAFNDSVGAAVDTSSLSKRIDDKLNITDTANKWMPRNTPIVTAFNGRAGNVLPQSADYSAYYEPLIAGGTTAQYWRGDKTWQALTSSVVPEGTNLYYTDTRARAAITLTTIGASGAATYANGVLNIPNYTFVIPNLQQVTDAGNVTTNSIRAQQHSITNPADPSGSNLGSLMSVDYGSGEYGGMVRLKSRTTNNFSVSVRPLVLTGDRLIQLPDKDGTIALLSDITGGTGGTGAYEPPITSGTTSQYWRGDKTWQDLNAAARAAISVTGGGTYDNTTGVINITGGSSSGWALGGNTGATNVFGLTSNNSLRMYTNSTARMVIDSLGFIGIGTAPHATRRLNVSGGINIVGGDASGVGLYIPNNGAIRGLGTTNGTIYLDASLDLSGTINLRGTTVNLPNITNSRLYSGDQFNAGIIAVNAGFTLASQNILTLKSDSSTLRVNDNTKVTKIGFRASSNQMNDNGGSPINWTYNNSAVLELNSTTRGFLPTRMTSVQRSAIASPPVGLHVYQTDGTEGMYVYKSTGWQFAY